MRFLIGCICVLFFSSFALTQELGKVKREGETYVKYAVMKGNTLYSLHIKYGVSEEALKAANPGLTNELKIGQILYIPASTSKNNDFTIHVVKRHETLFGISREYNCSVDDLLKLNPGAEKGLDVGQELKIPSSKNVASTPTATEDETPVTAPVNPYQNDSVISYTVNKGETLYSISKRFMVSMDKLMEVNNLTSVSIKKGQVLSIPLKKQDTSNLAVKKVPTLDTVSTSKGVFIPRKEKYKILVLLPMNLSASPKIISGLYDENTKLNKLTDAAVQFLMGAQLAIDSLEKLGLSGDVKFFDTERKAENLKKILTDSNTQNWDIVIGPFFPKLLKQTADWGKVNKVPVIAVTNIPTAYLKGNPYLFSMVPSRITMIGGMAKYIAQRFPSAHVVMMNGSDEKEKEHIAYFKEVFTQNSPDSSTSTIMMGSIGSASGSGMASHFDLNRKNFIICLSSDVQKVMQFVNALNAAKNLARKYNEADVVMVGLKNWNDMTPLNDYYKNKFKFHYASSNFVNYDTLNVVNFNIEYRAKYGSDPSIFALHGFDVVLSQLSDLLLGEPRNNGLIDHFEIHRLGPDLGNVNGSIFIVEQSDFTLKLKAIVDSKVHFSVK